MLPKGFKFAAVEAGVKNPGRLDMGLIFCETEASVGAVFTKNKVVAAPVVLSRERAKRGHGRAVLVNSGNANACTGERGMADAVSLTAAAASRLGVDAGDVLVCSTGVIGENLPVDRMEGALDSLVGRMGDDPMPFAESILTTDLVTKVAHRTLEFGGEKVSIMGVVKGSGMIRPDMATMLGFIVTDAKVSGLVLGHLLERAVTHSFNRITVDGDTSTNDTVIAMASCLSDAPALEDDAEGGELFCKELKSLCKELARMIVRDGEGATKVVDVTVVGARDGLAAENIAFTIAESPLVKTAIHGEDPNWGRIAGALGRSNDYEGGPFDIEIGGIPILKESTGLSKEAEGLAHKKMCEKEYEIRVRVGDGEGEASVVTCDFSAQYVSINADYRS